jgi:hypothetical protein
MKMVRNMWARMSLQQKEHYKKLSDTDRSRFDSERRTLKGKLDQVLKTMNAEIAIDDVVNPTQSQEE